jgi:hypothetical protein
MSKLTVRVLKLVAGVAVSAAICQEICLGGADALICSSFRTAGSLLCFRGDPGQAGISEHLVTMCRS